VESPVAASRRLSLDDNVSFQSRSGSSNAGDDYDVSLSKTTTPFHLDNDDDDGDDSDDDDDDDKHGDDGGGDDDDEDGDDDGGGSGGGDDDKHGEDGGGDDEDGDDDGGSGDDDDDEDDGGDEDDYDNNDDDDGDDIEDEENNGDDAVSSPVPPEMSRPSHPDSHNLIFARLTSIVEATTAEATTAGVCRRPTTSTTKLSLTRIHVHASAR